MISVKATREGLIGQRTYSGYIVDPDTPFVALPSEAAIRQWVVVRNPRNGKAIRALVLDVGPWNLHDHQYVFQMSTLDRSVIPNQLDIRPQAETGVDKLGRKTNKAGIDLGEKVWNHLEMTDNDIVEWAFL